MSTESNTSEAIKQQELPDHLKIKMKTDKVRTPGWRVFDFLVHFVINWIGNIGASLWFADDQAKYNIRKHIEAGRLEGDKSKYNPRLPGLYKFVDEKARPFFNRLWGVKYEVGKEDRFGNPVVTAETAGRNEGAGITTDVLFLSIGGHITTAATQLFENSTVKPKMVRWLDKMLDSFGGRKLTEAQRAERDAIYDKLDNELSGKSFAQTWKARGIGIIGVIVSLFGLRLADKAYTKMVLGKDLPNSEAGLNRVKQGFLWTTRMIKGGLRENSVSDAAAAKMDDAAAIEAAKQYPWTPDFLHPMPTEKELANGVMQRAGHYYADHMARLAATEVSGTTITSITQYIALMFKEFFQKKPSKEEQQAEAIAKTNTTKPAGVPITAEARTELDKRIESTIGQNAQEKQEAERAAYAAKIAHAKKPEKSEDHRDAVIKSTQPQEAALAGA